MNVFCVCFACYWVLGDNFNTTFRPNIKQNRGKIHSLKNVVCYRKDKAAGTQFLPSPCELPGTGDPVWHNISSVPPGQSHLLSQTCQWNAIVSCTFEVFTGLHVQKAYTSLGTSCHNAYTKFFCWLLMHICILIAIHRLTLPKGVRFNQPSL